MAIQSVDELISAIKQQDSPTNVVHELNKVDPVLWGPPTSLEGGDAAGRMGIDMGEPSVKAAAMRNLLIAYNLAEKEAAVVGPALAAAGKGISKFAPNLLKRLGSKMPPSVHKTKELAGKGMNVAGPPATVYGVGAEAHYIGNINKTRRSLGAGVG